MTATLVVTLAPTSLWPDSSTLATVPWVRNDRSAVAGLKTTSYAENAVALAEAHRLGASEAVLGDTYGLMIYQESVMRVAQKFAGYSLAEADNLRKAMGKKVRWLEEEEWDDENLRNRFFSPEGDFDRYEGTWVFLPEGEGTRVVLTLTYELTIPIFGGLLRKLVQKLMQENVESLLKGLEERVLAASS